MISAPFYLRTFRVPCSLTGVINSVLLAVAAVLTLATGSLAGTAPPPQSASGELAPSARTVANAPPQRGASAKPRAPGARGAGLPWTNTTIDAGTNVGSMLSVAVVGVPPTPHVSYYDAASNGGDLKYATLNSSGAWVTETVLSTPNDEGNVTSIATDAIDRPYILHYDQTNSTWKLAFKFGVWINATIEDLNAPGTLGRDSGMDWEDCELYVAYPDVGATGIRFGVTTADPFPDFPFSITSHEIGLNIRDIEMFLVLSTAHLAYIDTDSFNLHYATRTSGGTFSSQIAQMDVGCAGCTVSIAVDSQGRPHIIYPKLDGGTSAITHTWLDGGNWFAEDLETGTLFDDFANFSLQIDAFDNLHVGYQKRVTGQLRYAKKVGGSWSLEDVTPMAAGIGGQHVGLFLKGSCPQIVRHDPTSLDLEFEFPAGGSTHFVPDDHATIGEALSFACEGDTVRVAEGTYPEAAGVDFGGKSLALISDNGPASTIIDTGVLLDRSSTGFTEGGRIEGFTIRNGNPGINVRDYSGTAIENCVVQATPGFFGGLYFHGSILTVSDCVVSGNTATSGAAGLTAVGGQVDVIGSTIAGNRSTDNDPLRSSGGVTAWANSTINLERCIVWGNCSLFGSTEEINAEQTGTTINLTDCVVDSTGVGGAGTINYISGNVFSDPQFCAPEPCANAPTTAGDYSLVVLSADAALGLPAGFYVAEFAWGDYDSDGDLDLAAAGTDELASPFARIYRQDPAGLVDVGAPLVAVDQGDLDWGDYDNDGDLDLVLAGWDGTDAHSVVYRNDGGSTFQDIGAALEGVRSAARWGDYDNDGDLDLALSGENSAGTRRTLVYRNDGGTFVNINAGLFGLAATVLRWGDYDNDSDLDLVMTGRAPGLTPIRLYRNDSGTFVNVTTGFPSLSLLYGSLDWDDYDNDGDLDLAVAGEIAGDRIARIYRNDSGTFTDIGASLQKVRSTCVEWGDYDNDGDSDLLIAGREQTSGIRYTNLYRNDAGTFVEACSVPLPDLDAASAVFGDYDNDGKLDLALSGRDGTDDVSAIYRNEVLVANTPPTAPTNLTTTVNLPTNVTLSWDAATDAETPPAGLSYNLRVGTTPGGREIMSAMADDATGYRRIPEFGNAGHNLSWTLDVPGLPIYWSVQAVDAAWAGSAFGLDPATDVTAVEGVPSSFALSVPRPNPFHGQTKISFDIPVAGRTTVSIYDISGRLVKKLVDGDAGAGRHTLLWSGRNESGRHSSPGVYFVRLETGEHRFTERVVRLR